MATKVGVGVSTEKDNHTAGRAAARQALEKMGGGQPQMVLVFATTGYDQQKLLDGISEVTGSAPMTGCSGEGIITQQGSDEGSHAVAVMAFTSDKMKFHLEHFQGVKERSKEAGEALCKKMSVHKDKNSKVMVVFPDGLTANNTLLLQSLDANAPFPWKIVGGTSGDMWNMKQTYQYHMGKAYSDSVSALLIEGAVLPEITVGHGCEPIGLERTVTKTEANWIHELDGKPAWEAFKEYLDGDPQDLLFTDLVHLCIGEKLPQSEAVNYDTYIIRTPLGLNKEKGALYFPAEIKEGTKVKMTRRDTAKIAQNVKELAKQVAAKHPGKKPVAVLHLDCSGRGRVLFGDKINASLVDPFQELLGKNVPWIGFHTYGEIAPLGNTTHFHNYTVVLCALYEDAA